jgi:hypothetical protein
MSLVHTLSTPKGFLNRYLQHLITCETQIEAYEQTEIEHEALFNRRKYSSYDSFRRRKNKLAKIN